MSKCMKHIARRELQSDTCKMPLSRSFVAKMSRSNLWICRTCTHDFGVNPFGV